MKTNMINETEQQFRQDVNLREAVRRSCDREPQLSADFAARLQQRILSGTAPVSQSVWRKVAAAFIGFALMGGLAWATFRVVKESRGGAVATDVQPTQTAQAVSPSSRQFGNTRLDSILAIVAAHYGRKVLFLSEEPRQLRFTIAWDGAQPLATFIADVNEFDVLRLTDRRDTIIVEQINGEGEE